MAPEGQAHWEEYEEQGVIILGMMLQDTSGQPAETDDAARWADTFGLTHPVIADHTGENENWVTTGYPTFVVIDQTMTIVEDDLWPVDFSVVDALVEEGGTAE